MGELICPSCGERVRFPDVYFTDPEHFQQTLDNIPEEGGIIALLPGVYEGPFELPKGAIVQGVQAEPFQ